MSGDQFDGDRDAFSDYDDSEVALAKQERNTIVKRSFEGVSSLMQNAATQALTATATADINARWMIAMHRPRDIDMVREAIMLECKRPGFAAKAIYEVPRAGAKIKGMTIRFAEALLQAMGNMDSKAETLYDSDEERVVRVRVIDYERNSSWSRDITVHKTKEVKSLNGQTPISQRTNSSGQVVYKVEATDDDVATKEASAISKTARTGILRLVPGWLVEECRVAVEATQRDRAAKDPDAYRRRAVDAYASIGLKVAWMVEWLGKPLEQATTEDLLEMERLYRAFKEKEMTPADAMRARKGDDGAKATGSAAAAVTRSKRTPKPADQTQQTTPPPISPDEAAEIARLEREGK